MLRRLAALSLLSVVPFALPTQLASATTHRVVVIHDCTHRAYRPERIELACVNQQFVMTQIHYVGWNLQKAIGTDRTMSNQCQPTCTNGMVKFHNDRFVLDCPQHTNGHWFFTRARIYRNGALYVTWPLETAPGQWPYPSYGKTAPICQSH